MRRAGRLRACRLLPKRFPEQWVHCIRAAELSQAVIAFNNGAVLEIVLREVDERRTEVGAATGALSHCWWRGIR